MLLSIEMYTTYKYNTSKWKHTEWRKTEKKNKKRTENVFREKCRIVESKEKKKKKIFCFFYYHCMRFKCEFFIFWTNTRVYISDWRDSYYSFSEFCCFSFSFALKPSRSNDTLFVWNARIYIDVWCEIWIMISYSWQMIIESMLMTVNSLHFLPWL